MMQTTGNTEQPRNKMQAYRARMRAAGLRPLQIWVPDVDRPDLAVEARRQSLLAAASASDRDAQAFIDNTADTGNPA